MAELKGAVLTAIKEINIRSASIGNYYDRNQKRITQAGAKFLELSETAKQREDWKGRLELWKQDTLIISNESVDKLQVQLQKLGNEAFQVDSNEATRKMEIAHPFMVNIKKLIEDVDAVMCQIQLQWVSGLVDDFIYEQASNQSINALNKIISRFVYLSDESAKRNRGLFSQRTFERMISKEVRELANGKTKESKIAIESAPEREALRTNEEKSSQSDETQKAVASADKKEGKVNKKEVKAA